jgi:hypothetical protein
MILTCTPHIFLAWSLVGHSHTTSHQSRSPGRSKTPRATERWFKSWFKSLIMITTALLCAPSCHLVRTGTSIHHSLASPSPLLPPLSRSLLLCAPDRSPSSAQQPRSPLEEIAARSCSPPSWYAAPVPPGKPALPQQGATVHWCCRQEQQRLHAAPRCATRQQSWWLWRPCVLRACGARLSGGAT